MGSASTPSAAFAAQPLAGRRQERRLPVLQQLRQASTETDGASEARSTTDAGAGSSERSEEARQLLRDILDVVQEAGPEAGALRSLQAARAAALTAADLLLKGDVSTLLESLQAGKPDEALIARALRQLFQRLGATYIKLGQFIASSPTLFPEVYVREFQQCIDQGPEVSPRRIRKIIEADLGRPVDTVFSAFNNTPLASASVAQVHAATLANTGEEVVVKVLKPGVGKVLQADLGFLFIAARVLEFLSPEIAKTSLADLAGEIRSSMLNELDLEREAKNLELFRAFLDQNSLTDVAAAPRSYTEASAKRVLTMERFHGVPLTDLEGIRQYTGNPEETLITALNVWALSVRGCDIFHADVHAGNLLVLEDGRVGFIDFGIVGSVPPEIWQAVEELTVAFVAQDQLRMAKALISMGATSAKVDEARLAADIDSILERLRNLQPEVRLRSQGDGTVAAMLDVDEAQVTDLLLEVIRAADDNGLKLPREFALLVKQALYFDRYTKLLAPDLDPLRDDRVDLGVTSDGPRSGGSPGASGPAIGPTVIDV